MGKQLNVEKESLVSKNEEVNAALKELKEEHEKVRTQLRSKQMEISSSEERLNAAIREKDKTYDSTNSEITRLRESVKKAKTKAIKLDGEYRNERESRKKKEKEIKSLKKKHDEFKKNFSDLKEKA